MNQVGMQESVAVWKGVGPMKTKGNVLAGGNTGKLVLAVLVGCASLLVQGLRAEDSDGAQAARAVRLNSVEGTVHLSRGSQVLTDQAMANTPLFEGTRIDTGNDGRAEIQFEDGSVARVSPQSSLSLTFLRGIGDSADRDAEVQINGGLAYFELQGDTESNQIRVRFGETVITASGFTVLRINLDKAPGEVAVFSGNAHLEGGPTPGIDLHGGESVALNATDPANYNLSESIEPDSWDAWNSDRDQEMTTASAERTDATNSLPDSNNPAWSDLDANGNWYSVPGEGYVWSPNEAASPEWDPYGNGYWMSTPTYGYMWISGNPWGYLPYQCGAWNYYSSFGWGWAPGVCAPWWGGYGGWTFNIGFAPPHYHCPVRPRNPRPMGGVHAWTPLPVVAVNRPLPFKNMTPAPRDRTGTVMIAGNVVRPLAPVQQTRNLYFNHSGPGSPTHTGTGSRPANGFESGYAPHPVGTPTAGPTTGRGTTNVWPSAPKPGSPTYTPRPAPSVPVYAPPPRPSGSSPAPPVRTYTPPPRTYTPPPAPVRSAPPPSPPPASHPSGGGAAPRANPR
jgi:hypothetical protein